MKVGDLVKYKCTFSRYSGQTGIIVAVGCNEISSHLSGYYVQVRWQDGIDWYPNWHLWSVSCK